MKLKTKLKAGALTSNHNQILIRKVTGSEFKGAKGRDRLPLGS